MNCNCGNLGIYFCANCNYKAYCCKDCQINDWKNHKIICNNLLMDNIEYVLSKEFTSTFFDIHRDFELNVMNILIDKQYRITVLPSKKWNDIKNMVYNMINQNSDYPLCNSCCGKLIHKISCENCKNIYCSSCYIESYKKNSGFVICPYCNYRIGNYVSSKKLLCGVGDIINRLNIMSDIK